MFLMRMRMRIFILGSLTALFNYWGNLLGLGASKAERTFKKYKRRWIYKHNPSSIVYETAIETTFKP